MQMICFKYQANQDKMGQVSHRLNEMLLFAHTGITLGAAALISRTLGNNKKSWITSAGDYLDVRLLMIGSLLPDIIDKPVGQLLFRETLSNGRIFSHTILFLALIAAAGLYLHQRRHKSWLLVLSFGTLTHLILDQMWRIPQTLFWPLFGFSFDKINLTEWIPNIFYRLLTSPEVYVPELVGIAIILWFGITLLLRKRIYAFIRHGQVR